MLDDSVTRNNWLYQMQVPSSAYLITDKDYKSLTPADYAAAKGQSKVKIAPTMKIPTPALAGSE